MNKIVGRHGQRRSPSSSNYHTTSFIVEQLRTCRSNFLATAAHAQILKSGIKNNTTASNHLLNCYKRLREINLAHKLFVEMHEPNVVSWTSILAAYVDSGQSRMALDAHREMQESSVAPNDFTYATVINACSALADLEAGKKLHAHVEIKGFQISTVVASSLIDMYGKCNDIDGSRRVFNLMCFRFRNVVSWSSMISMYAQNGRELEALQLFGEFNRSVREKPYSYMLASVINACGRLGRLINGRNAHGAVICNGYQLNVVVASSLVDMYAKCGCFSDAETVFRRISNPCVITYTSIITGAAKYGFGKLSLELFEEMIGRRITPNEITFIGVLHACSHAGLVDDGLKYLSLMEKNHGIIPDSRHYNCVVDMLSRIGSVEEAYQLAKRVKANAGEGVNSWGTILSACSLQGNINIALECSRRLVALNQQVACACKTLSNTFALAGEWDSVHSLRHEMKQIGVCGEPGRSWLELMDSSATRETPFLFLQQDSGHGG